MNRREPPDVAILAARIMRAWPSLSPYSCASLATELCSIERAQHRHAERQCSGADGGYVRWRSLARDDDNAGSPRTLEHDPEAEQRAERRIERRIAAWRNRVADIHPESPTCTIELQDDPRGAVLLLRLPGEQEASTV